MMQTEKPKTVLVPIADGSEEMEVVIVVDCLRRAHIQVVVAGVGDLGQYTCRSSTKIVPDKKMSECQETIYDLICLPGGLKGAEAIYKDEICTKMIKSQHKAGRLVAAVCAAPMILKDWGLLTGHTATIYPSLESKLGDSFVSDKVVVSNNVITSQGPGTCFDFALKLIELLVGREEMQKVKKAVLC